MLVLEARSEIAAPRRIGGKTLWSRRRPPVAMVENRALDGGMADNPAGLYQTNYTSRTALISRTRPPLREKRLLVGKYRNRAIN
jgi:hypothetical protein